MMYDVIIIGAGAVGCACARELSKYKMKIAVLEKESDVACGTSGRNSAVVHAGFNNKPGSLMAKFCVEGNKQFQSVCEELDVPYKKTGKYLVAFDQDDIGVLEGLIRQGEANGIEGLELISGDKLRGAEPYLDGIMAMKSPNTAIFNPFLYTVALAENAKANGADFFFNRELIKVSKIKTGYSLQTKDGTVYTTTRVINAAGLYSADVASLFGIEEYHIYPCRGEYFVLDKEAQNYIHTPIYPAPRKGIGGLGVHLTPTIDGNVIIGPSAEYIDALDDYSTTQQISEKLLKEAGQLLPQITRSYVIASYSGLRSKQAPKNEGGFRDFVVNKERFSPNLINLIGIESPGLTASIPIARYVIQILSEDMKLTEKEVFNPVRRGIPRFRDMSYTKKKQMIEIDSEYGEIFCRCENVTKKEVRMAIENSLGTITLRGIKNRTRCMMGRCQGGYCMTRIVDMLIKDYGFNPEDIRLKDFGTEMFSGRVK